MYSNPAGHGVFILDRILRDPAMMAEWQRELRTMVGRVADMRRELRKRLEKLAPSHDWAPIANQGTQFNEKLVDTGFIPQKTSAMMAGRNSAFS